MYRADNTDKVIIATCAAAYIALCEGLATIVGVSASDDASINAAFTHLQSVVEDNGYRVGDGDDSPLLRNEEAQEAIDEAESMGFFIKPCLDKEQQGKFYFLDPHGNSSEVFFETEDDAWDRIIAETGASE